MQATPYYAVEDDRGTQFEFLNLSGRRKPLPTLDESEESGEGE